MQITNNLNLPAAFVHAVSTERHNAPHCYSATTLNKGAKGNRIDRPPLRRNHSRRQRANMGGIGVQPYTLARERKKTTISTRSVSRLPSVIHVTGQVDSYDMERGINQRLENRERVESTVCRLRRLARAGLNLCVAAYKKRPRGKKCRFVALA